MNGSRTKKVIWRSDAEFRKKIREKLFDESLKKRSALSERTS